MASIVSIVSPSFNQAQFLEATIRSVATQEGDFCLDYIIVDGGSTDGSIEIIREWDAKLREGADIRQFAGLSWLVPIAESSVIRCRALSFRWQSSRDSGQSEAINNGFDLAVGELGGWVNSDDIFLPKAIQNAFKAYNHERCAVFGMAQAVDENGVEKWTQGFWKHRFTYYDAHYRDYTPPQPSVFFPTKLFREVGGLNESLHYLLDADLWQRMLLAGASFVFISQIWSRQTYHPASKSMSGGILFGKFGLEKARVSAWRKREIGIRAHFWSVLRCLEMFLCTRADQSRKLLRRLIRTFGKD